MNLEMPRAEIDALSQRVIGAAIEVHQELGPGLLESTCETCLSKELAMKEIEHQRQVVLPIAYKGEDLDAGYPIHILVEGPIVLELKAVEKVTELHKAQRLTYLKLSGAWLGLLRNFHTPYMRDGITRMVNG